MVPWHFDLGKFNCIFNCIKIVDKYVLFVSTFIISVVFENNMCNIIYFCILYTENIFLCHKIKLKSCKNISKNTNIMRTKTNYIPVFNAYPDFDIIRMLFYDLLVFRSAISNHITVTYTRSLTSVEKRFVTIPDESSYCTYNLPSMCCQSTQSNLTSHCWRLKYVMKLINLKMTAVRTTLERK